MTSLYEAYELYKTYEPMFRNVDIRARIIYVILLFGDLSELGLALQLFIMETIGIFCVALIVGLLYSTSFREYNGKYVNHIATLMYFVLFIRGFLRANRYAKVLLPLFILSVYCLWGITLYNYFVKGLPDVYNISVIMVIGSLSTMILDKVDARFLSFILNNPRSPIAMSFYQKANKNKDKKGK